LNKYTGLLMIYRNTDKMGGLHWFLCVREICTEMLSLWYGKIGKNLKRRLFIFLLDMKRVVGVLYLGGG